MCAAHDDVLPIVSKSNGGGGVRLLVDIAECVAVKPAVEPVEVAADARRKLGDALHLDAK